MTIARHRFDDLAAAARALADHLAGSLRASLAARGKASVAVSGGKTPAIVYRLLRDRDIDWRRVTVTLTDERWVPATDSASNERLVRTELLRDRASAATFVPMFGDEDSPEAGRPACEQRLAAIGLPLDAVYLGIGEDGHFASLFPHDDALDCRGQICAAVPATDSRAARMTLTIETVLAAGDVTVLYNGARKEATFSAAMGRGDPDALPLRRLIHQDRTRVTVFSAP